MRLTKVVDDQRQFFAAQATKPIPFRINALKKLRDGIISYEEQILVALKQDLNKAEFESYMTELGMVLNELQFLIKNTRKWAKQRRVKTPLALFPARSFIVPEPYGVVLIMSPWNYPFQLSILPLLGAIAAGNCVVIKPSAYAPSVSHVIAEIIKDCFPPEYVTVIEGGRAENQALLEQKFDYIFFTGGVTVGKLVMEKAAQYLTPITLELGGKSPCIVDRTADLKLAAKRIAFGKLLNCGQTCVAPDYLFVDKEIKDQLINYLRQSILDFLGPDPLNNPDYPQIINEKHYHRLMNLISDEDIVLGGVGNNNKIEPTIVDHVSLDSQLMQEEIFGPILPVITFTQIEETVSYINSRPKPLALYLFTSDKETERFIINNVSYGGGCINDTIMHLATPYLGFGGVGASGIGSYHGKQSFNTFSHLKSIVKRGVRLDVPLRYHPYSSIKERLLRKILK